MSSDEQIARLEARIAQLEREQSVIFTALEALIFDDPTNQED